MINPLISSLGVQMMDGILVQSGRDNPADMIKPQFTPSITAISEDLEGSLKDSIGVSMPNAAGLTYTTGGPFLIKPLLMTDPKLNWNKKGKLVLDSADVTFSVTDGDTQAAIPTALALTRQVNNKEQRIVVTGDADFLSNKEINRFRTANFAFGVGIFGWFTYGRFPVNTSRPPSRDTRLDLTDKGVNALKVLFLGIFPGLLAIGGVVFLVRRKRK
jgi:ABC-2 type transport system permease protein